jgi:hypothetical protein
MPWLPAAATSSVITVVTAGTPVQVATVHTPCQAVFIQAMPNNTGRTVIGSDNTVRANAAGSNPSGTVLAILGAPSSNTATPPSANGGNPPAPVGLNLKNLWIDASTSGEAVIVSYIV